jgi:hypothetical protein
MWNDRIDGWEPALSSFEDSRAMLRSRLIEQALRVRIQLVASADIPVPAAMGHVHAGLAAIEDHVFAWEWYLTQRSRKAMRCNKLYANVDQ